MRTDTIETAAGSSLEIIIEGAGDDVLIYHHGTPAAGPVEAELLEAATTHNFTIVQVVRPGYGASTRQMQRSVADVARELGLVEQTLGNWVRQERIDRGEREGTTTEIREENVRLRREVKHLTMERDLLKKATAFWVKESER